MTKRLECVIEGCDAAIEAETEEEVLAHAEEHAGEEHPDLELDDDTVETIQSAIQDV
ncbi:MAG: putative small metal-binding protein [Haloarculaceae archaeon]|jgi:predicted small metal-binding protein